jgi:hypothetical protein
MTGSDSLAVADTVRASLVRARIAESPFRHLLIDDVLSPPLCEALAALPVAAPDIGDTKGKRETHNSLRFFLNPVQRARFPYCDAVATAFQSPDVTEALDHRFAIDLAGTLLRIEYCQDHDGFWLEPHTDIGAKRLTLLIYLSDEPRAADWGTDLYDLELRHVGRTDHRRNAGLAFVPAGDTWHGFERRPIVGVRRTLIVNFVGPEWRSRHELSFPDSPVGTAKGFVI